MARPGESATSRNKEPIEKIQQIVIKACRLAIQKIAHKLRRTIGSMVSIFIEDLCTRSVSAKFTPSPNVGRAAEATLHENNSGNAGMCKPRPNLHEDHHH